MLEEEKTSIKIELQHQWLRYLNQMIETNTIHCTKTELAIFYRVWNTDSYSYSDAVVLNHLLKKHPLKKLKKLIHNKHDNIDF